MNEFKYAFRRFFKGGRLNIIKIISLGLGFAISFILLAKVAYELSYDDYIKDNDRVFFLKTTSSKRGAETKEYMGISGAVAPGMKKEIPQVEVATRWTSITGDSKIFTDQKSGISFNTAVLADEYFFDLITTDIISGDPKKILTQSMYCMISDEVADKIDGEVIGKQIQFKAHPGKYLTVGGVFKALPSNSSFDMDILVSMPSIGNFTWDGSENWLGNDRYTGLIKLTKGTNPEDIKESIYRMQQKYQDIDKIKEEYNAFWTYTPFPIRSLHFQDNVVSTTLSLVAIIGIVVLLMSLFNYLLLRITSIINSSRNTGIRKSLGAEKSDIMKGILADTITHLFFALLAGILFVLIFKKTIGDMLNTPLEAMLTPTTALVMLGVLFVSGLIISMGPGRIIAKQPLMNTIRNHQQSNRRWKIGLLFLEGLGVTFLLCTVYFVHKQYNHMLRLDKGYDVQNVYGVSTASIDSLGIKNSVEVLRNLPEVESVSLASVTPIDKYQSGDNLFDDSGKEIRNVSDYFWCDEYYFDLFKIPIVEGEGFDTAACHSKNAIVNETFAHHLVEDFGWTDGVIGKEINITSHSNPMTIIGVCKDFKTNRFGKVFLSDESVVIAGGAWYRFCEIMLIRIKDSEPESVKKVTDIINEYSIFWDTELISLEREMRNLFNGIQNLGHYTLFGATIAIIIALIGIIGYTEEEVTRRRKEIAIRKVNGASSGAILKLFITRYLRIGILSTTLGLAIAFIAIRSWVETQSEQVSLSPLYFILIGLGVLVATCLIMAIYCYFTANQNPTKYLTEE